MAKKAWVLQDFEGGWSTDLKVGQKNSHALLQGLNFRGSPSQLTLEQQLAREDNGVVKDLVQNEVMVQNGVTYSMGNTGFIYRRSTAGVWGAFGKVRNGYFGLDYRQDLDSIYACSDKSVSLINPISSNPALTVDYYGISASTYNNTTNAGLNVNTAQSGSSSTYTVPLAPISEATNDLRYFQTDIEPLSKISVFIVAKGTGNWTLTLHDGLNNVLGTSTVTNGNLINQQFNDFVFSSQVRVSVAPAARTYHFHLTSTVADGTVSTSTQSSLNNADLQVWADRLVIPSNGMHPMTTFQQFECIGNANYLSVWEPLGDPNPPNSEWQRHKLQFPPYYQVCGLAVFNEYLAIACERIATSSTTQQDGIIFFWDGLSTTYNYFVKVPEGSPQAICQKSNVLYYQAGVNWYALASPTSVPVKIRHLPNASNAYTTATNQTRINPYAICTRYSTLLMAWPSTTTNPNINYGAYSWASTDKNYAPSFGYNYTLSTGSTNYSNSNNLQIGMIQNFGDLLHISWRDDLNGGYGVDALTASSAPASYATFNSMIFDNGYVSKQKEGDYMEASWLPLPNGVTIVLKYQVNRGGWVYSNGSTATSVGGFTNTNTWQDGDGYARLSIGENTAQVIGQSNEPGRFNEIQLGMDIYCSGATTSPTVTSISLVFDDMRDEALQ